MDAGFEIRTGRLRAILVTLLGFGTIGIVAAASSGPNTYHGWHEPDLAPIDGAPGFRRFRRSRGERDHTGLGRGWSHEYWMRLTGSRESLSLHLPDRVLAFRRERSVVSNTDSVAYVALPRPAGPIGDDATVGASVVPGGSGMIVRDGEGFRWHAPDGRIVHFRGAYPVAIRDGAQGRIQLLRYHAGRLTQVVVPARDGRTGASHTDDVRYVIAFHYDGDSLVSVERSDGVSAHFPSRGIGQRGTARRGIARPNALVAGFRTGSADGQSALRAWRRDECSPAPGPTDPSAERCDRARNPPPEGFRTPVADGGPVRRVDIRPASCRSYFTDYAGIRRGREIETALAESGLYAGMTPTVPNFPVADFVGEASVVAVVSHDLTADRFTDPNDHNALYDVLMARGADMERRLLTPVRELGSIRTQYGGRESRVDDSTIERPIVDLVLRHGTLTVARQREIERARADLATRYGIELRVVEIP